MPDKIKYYTEDNFLDRDDSTVLYGFFTRLGGVSSGIYDSLNCGTGSEDKPDHVFRNRAAVADELGITAENLLSTYQVHDSKVVHVTKPWVDRPHADAMVTDRHGIGIGVLTADCTPVLFVGKKTDESPVIGAAHAGWKGALSGVLDNTILAMVGLGVQKESIRACVGPCIGKNAYEVSSDFIIPFIKESEESERFFHAASKEGHAMFDLPGYCAWRLAREGVKQVSILDKDTYTNENEFFSYRRSVHREEEDYGRQISVITIHKG